MRALAEWFVHEEVEEVVMESTAQYWRAVWETLERYWQPRPSDARGRWSDIGHPASGASPIESRTGWTEEGFPRRRPAGEAVGCTGTHLNLRTGGGAASLADGDAP
jgi:hypothetical protein